MNHRSKNLKLDQKPFWQRILERHKFRGRLLAARVPLIFFRFWSPGDSRPARTRSQPTFSPYLLRLHIGLSWPQWLVNAYGRGIGFEQSIFAPSVIKELKWLGIHQRSIDSLAHARSNEALASLHTTPFPVVADRLLTVERGISVSAKIQRFTETLGRNQQSNFLHRGVSAPTARRIGEVLQTGNKISPSATSQQSQGSAAIRQVSSQRSEVARNLNNNVERSQVHASAPSQLIHRETTDAHSSNSLGGDKSRLYATSAWLNFANPTPANSNERIRPQEQSTLTRPPTTVQTVQPKLDIGRLSEEVYRHIQRKIRVERERRGQ